jgi:hypothetical protein
VRLQLAWGLLVAAATPLAAQQPAQLHTTALTTGQRGALRVASVRLTGDSVRIMIGDALQLSAAALDAAGNAVTGARILFNVGGGVAVLVGSDRQAATKPGRSEVRAFVLKPAAPGCGPTADLWPRSRGSTPSSRRWGSARPGPRSRPNPARWGGR